MKQAIFLIVGGQIVLSGNLVRQRLGSSQGHHKTAQYYVQYQRKFRFTVAFKCKRLMTYVDGCIGANRRDERDK